jgi:hypothetical protein
MDSRESSARRCGEDKDEVTCFYCLGGGYHFIGSIDEDGEEIVETLRCRRCDGTGELNS